MQSQLTRRVFRAILNNEPLSSSKCRHRFLHTLRPYQPRKLTSSPHYVQRRALFAFNIAPPSAPPPATLPSEVGLKPMKDFMTSVEDKSRGPTNDILAKAFEDFFAARTHEPGVITLFHAQLFSMTLNHLREFQDQLEPEEWQRIFTVESLENVLYVLAEAKCLPEARELVHQVARIVFSELCLDHGEGPNMMSLDALLAFINIQVLNGFPEPARYTVMNFWHRLRDIEPSPWLSVIQGFAMEGKINRLKKSISQFHQYGGAFDPASQETMISVFIKQDLVDAVELIYECLPDDLQPNLSTKLAVLRFAILKSRMEWAESILQSLSEEPMSKILGVTLLRDAAHGEDASTIAAKVNSLTAEFPDIASSLTITCVNDLIECANLKNKSRLAFEFAELATVWGLSPDHQTRLLLLESHIQNGDAGKTLEYLADISDLEAAALERLPLMNKLITFLCLSGETDAVFDQVSAFLDPLFDNNVRLESDTLVALTRLLLYRHDWEGISELLRPRLGSYDTAERTKIRTCLVNFILDLEQTSAQTWEVYGLLQIAFPETGVATRTKIMTSFFKRNRGDLAYLVFGHMRQAKHFAQRPKPDTYVRCLQGITQTQDAKHLELVHNMLKLDVEVDLNTRLLNWLMLAYAVCDKPDKSLQIFRDILQSKEGPSHRSISFFFKVCEKHHNGTQEAMKMMRMLNNLGVTLDRRQYTAYIESLAAQCEFDLATEAMDAMEKVTGYPPTHSSIGLFYNAIPYQYWKDEVEKWAKEQYPQQWEQLEEIERTDYEEGLKFNLSRNNGPLGWEKSSTSE